MKNAIIIFFIFLFFGVSKAQLTTPMPDTSASWTILSSYYDAPNWFYNHSRKVLVKDTLIDSLTYYQIGISDNQIDTNNVGNWLYRIDSLKVYLRENDGTEILRYDFGMQVGDSILVGEGPNYSYLDSIDNYVIQSGQTITRFIFSSPTSYYIADNVWYFGIGSGGSPFLSDDPFSYVTSFYYKGECYIFSGNSNICDANLNSVESINQNSNLFSLYPNPSSNYFTIQMPELIVNAIIEIYNSIGELVYSQKIENENQIVLRHDFDNGIYFVNVYSNNESYSQKIVISK